MIDPREVQALRVHEDQLAHEDFRVHRVNQVSQVSMDCQEKKDHQVLGEDPGCLVCQDLRDLQGFPSKVNLEMMAQMVMQDNQDKKE